MAGNGASIKPNILLIKHSQQPCLKPKDAPGTEPEPKTPNENNQKHIRSETELGWYSFLPKCHCRLLHRIEVCELCQALHKQRISDRELEFGCQCLTPCYLHWWWMSAKLSCWFNADLYPIYALQHSYKKKTTKEPRGLNQVLWGNQKIWSTAWSNILTLQLVLRVQSTVPGLQGRGAYKGTANT